MKIIEVKNISKHYEKFDLKNINFKINPGKIVGFIGRNGAGKTTTLKCMYNLIKPTSGEVLYGNKNILDIEVDYKQDVAILFGESDYYQTKTVKKLTDITKMFYEHWDDNLYHQYLKDFGIDENKQIKALSSGMKVKYGLAIALSRGAKILLLDEPTSGLDPVSRDELMDIFLNLVADKEHSILFSTHVISDLEKCADEIIYIKKGQVIVDQDVTTFESDYLHYQGKSELFNGVKNQFLYYRDRLGKFEGVIHKNNKLKIDNKEIECRKASMEEIMIAFEREIQDEEITN